MTRRSSFIFVFFTLMLMQMHGQQVVLTPGGYKSVSELQVGSQVIGKDGSINILLAKRTLGRAWFQDQSLTREFQWYLVNGKYKLFYHQSIYTDKILCHVSELKIGDWIFNRQHKEKVVSIKKLDSDEEWYKLDISGDHSYVSEIFLHNASRFWNKQNASANWNATAPTNWGATSGGTGAAAPTSADDVTFDGAGSGGNTNSTVSATIAALSLTFTSGYTQTLTVNAGVLLQIASGGSITLSANMTTAGTGTLNILGTCSLTSNGKTWVPAITCTGLTLVKTFVDNWTVNGLFTSNTNGAQTYNGSIVTLNAGLTLTNTAENMSGTTKFVLKGGSWGINGTLQNDLDIDGNVTITAGGTQKYATGTLNYLSGTVTTTGSTLSLTGSCTLNTAGITWNNITIAGTATYTLNSLLTATGTMTINNGIAPIFAGSSGWTVGTFTSNHLSSATMTLQHGVTYTITTAFNASQSRIGSPFQIASDNGTLKAILTLQKGATCNSLGNFIRIDASGGRTINTYNGTVTDCLNINSFGDLKTVSTTFFQ